MKQHNIISVSGGKDSTATVLLALALETENIQLVFADTGHEHPLTYDYVDYLSDAVSLPIRKVKADFSMQIERKRRKLLAGELPGWTDAATERALQALVPTGNPFLDMCMWKSRFPSTKARFCTEHLKRDPIIEQVFLPLLDAEEIVWSWQGIRRDESPARRYAKEFEEVGGGLFNYRPIARWTAKSVFEAHDYMGIKPNPLYKMGMGRVGCMPCVNCNKNELQNIALRFPEEVERVREWERLVSEASRRESATFFYGISDPTAHKTDTIHYKTHGIDRMVEWSQTTRGGRQLDLIAASADPTACSSAYGLCDAG
ncbi:3'-phosphoadenosine 5'-phosphosulfate sulfotransferase (PAPS reductase)/FAD synthetase [Amphritea atlantica]|uniref:3'-phosphoadenosine 5'-phosphosulfate sulfotransferase (PAPS reductase)/FAD synthetase n=1 Tax=Amphritea atlantica TaxID=355243 RepID=A0A1H9GDQ5_9GAMM|nr:phosphoadenosine phosphosulfate reductase family protein [Amphritea atlantica]SEQ48220.1 3'-phosphoadenosine 5'-phosphosulfate sulfotransferase (PAPS reductase)/FAD synthetase [Amphritea atlantica]